MEIRRIAEELSVQDTTSEKVALFDFCETLVSFQSADRFVDYVLSQLNSSYRSQIYRVLRHVLKKTKVLSAIEFFAGDTSVSKLLKVKQLKGVEKAKMELLAKDYYEQVIKPSLITETIDELKRLKTQGYRIIIVSGGFDAYLAFFCRDFGVEEPICTKLAYKGGKFSGRYVGVDCMGRAKLHHLSARVNVPRLLKCDSVAYSDSVSDIWLLKACHRGVVVCKSVPSWAIENGFDVLQWSKQ